MRSWLSTPSQSRDLTLLSVAVAGVYLASGSHPALGSSTRYVESCREMLELGDWVVPHLGYVPYLEKPILTYWLGAISRLLFGDNNLAAQAPAALSALITVFAVYGLGHQLRDRAFGLAAGFFLLGCGLFLGMTSTLTTDMPLTACLAVAWWAWGRWDGGCRTSNLWLWVFWFALGLGFLAKGPIAIVLAGAGLGGFALLTGGWRGVFSTLWAMRPFSGLVILALINLPWSLAVWQRDARLLEFFYIRINFQALFDGDINHAGPAWYYLPVLAGALMPFSFVTLPAWVVGVVVAMTPVWTRSALDEASRRRLYLACAALFPLLFLSVAASKLGTYILPLLPLVVITALDQILGGFRWWSRRLLVVTAVFFLFIAVAVPVVAPVLQTAGAAGLKPELLGLTWDGLDPEDLATVNWAWMPIFLTLALLLAVAMMAVLVALWRKRVGLALVVLGCGLTLLAMVVLPNLQHIVHDLNAARLIAVIRARGGDDSALPAILRDPVIIQQEIIHRYELDYALRRRVEIGRAHV